MFQVLFHNAAVFKLNLEKVYRDFTENKSSSYLLMAMRGEFNSYSSFRKTQGSYIIISI